MISLLNGTMFWNHGKMLLLFAVMPGGRRRKQEDIAKQTGQYSGELTANED